MRPCARLSATTPMGKLAHRWDFSEVNELIGRHNRWYPAESRPLGSANWRLRARQRTELPPPATRRDVGARTAPSRAA